jgi:hypothetical protein
MSTSESGRLSSVQSEVASSNNGLHQTGRGGAVASRPVVEARPAGEAECSAGYRGGKQGDQWASTR